MIPLRKPRGHFWTNPSTVQQTDGFRQICFEECTASTSKIFVRGSDESLSESERAAKRRRIERLADDFLDGQPLFISSARPCPDLLKSTIVWNKKSSTEPKFTLPDANRSNGSSALWEDVDDDSETLRKYGSRSKSAGSREADVEQQPDKQSRDEGSMTVQATAPCGPERKNKSLKVSDGPSEEALKQAAALRARRQQRAESASAAVPRSLTRYTRALWDSEESRSEPSIGIAGAINQRRTSPWLSRRKSQSASANPALNEDSDDELRLSRIETRSTPSRLPIPSSSQSLPQRSLRRRVLHGESNNRGTDHRNRTTDVATPEPVHVGSLLRNQSGSKPDAINRRSCTEHLLATAEPDQVNNTTDTGRVASRISELESYETAPEVTDIYYNEGYEQSQSQEKSETRLFRSQGIHGIPSGSWTPRNQDNSGGETAPSPWEAVESVNTSVSAKRKSSRQTAQRNDGKSTEGERASHSGTSTSSRSITTRKTRSAAAAGSPQNDVHARLRVDPQHCMDLSHLQTTYTNEEVSQKGSTPFVWRKRASGSYTGNAEHGKLTPQEQQTGRRRATFHSSDGRRPGAKQSSIDNAQQVDSNPPLLDISFGYDSSFAPKLNMALVDEHANTTSPRDPRTCRGTPADGDGQPGELESSTVDDNLVGSVFTKSVQDKSEAHHDVALQPSRREGNSSVQERTAASQFWPGTQAMLHQAQKDLFTSPEKRDPDNRNNATPSGMQRAATEPPTTCGREPFKQLSQEPMPSTQVILDDFEGFSTVKKPRCVNIASPLPTPTATGKRGHRLLKATDAQILPSVPSVAASSRSHESKRSSRLRFSVIPVESPHPLAEIGGTGSQFTTDISTTSVATPLATLKPNSAKRSAGQSPTGRRDLSSVRDPSEHRPEHDSPTSFTSLVALSSFEAAQERSSLRRDDSDIDRTVNELTDFLSTKDLEGVLSQVG